MLVSLSALVLAALAIYGAIRLGQFLIRGRPDDYAKRAKTSELEMLLQLKAISEEQRNTGLFAAQKIPSGDQEK